MSIQWLPVAISNAAQLTDKMVSGPQSNKEQICNSLLQQFEKMAKRLEDPSNPVTQRERDVSIRKLEKLLNRLETPAKEVERLAKISNEISALLNKLRMGGHTSTSTLLQNPPPTKSSPVLNLYFMCDIYAQDHNGTLTKNIAAAIQKRIPTIVTKSLVIGADWGSCSCEPIAQNLTSEIKAPFIQNLKSVITSHFGCLDVFLLGEFLLFIPKDYPFKFDELDFNLEKDFQRVESVDEIFSGPSEKATIEGFIDLFKPHGNVKKRIILLGHGNDQYLGGMPIKKYRKLIAFLEDSCCEWLDIRSCYAGNINNLKHHFRKRGVAAQKSAVHAPSPLPKRKKSEAGYLRERSRPSFPIMVRSIGAFPASLPHSEFEVQNSFQAYFNDLDKVLGKKIYTNSEFRKMIQNHESTHPQKDFKNLCQILFPCQKDSPSGFRPLNEEADAVSIGYVDMQAFNLNLGHLPRSSAPRRMIFDNKKFFEVLPIHLSVPIEIRGKAPIFLSMIPGNSHHLFKEMTVTGFDLRSLFTLNARTYKESEARKAFFFSKFYLDGKQMLSQMVFDFANAWSMRCYYVEGSPPKYIRYTYDVQSGALKRDELSSTEYAFEIYRIACKTTPLKDAVAKSSGGQEHNLLLFDNLYSQEFWQGFMAIDKATDEKDAGKACIPKDFYSLKEYFCNKVYDAKAAEALFNTLQEDSHQFILELALLYNHHHLAKILINRGKIYLNKKGDLEVPLINLAIQNRNLEIVQLMIEKGADLNAEDPKNKFRPLTVAAYYGYVEIVEALLQQQGRIEIDAVDSQGWTALQKSVSHPEVFRLILKTGKADINHVTNDGWTALSLAVHQGRRQDIEELLRNGANINVGNPPPLIRAIWERDIDMMQLLLQHGASVPTPLALNSPTWDPIKEAVKRGTPKILELLFSKIPSKARPYCAGQYVVVAKELGRLKILSYLLSLQPVPMSLNKKSLILSAFETNNFSLLDEIWEIGLETKLEVSELQNLLESCLKKGDFELLQRFVLLFKKQLNLEPLYGDGMLMRACKAQNLALFNFMLENGADPSLPQVNKSTFMTLVKSGNLEYVNACVDKCRIDLNPQDAYPYNYLSAALKEKQIGMFKFLVSKGANPALSPRDGSMPIIELLVQNETALFKSCFENLSGDKKQEILKSKYRFDAGYSVENIALYACKKDDKDLLKFVIDLGADPVDALKSAITKGDLESVKICLQSPGFKVNEGAANQDNLLKLAYKERKKDIVKALLDSGADPTLSLNYDKSLLEQIIIAGDQEYFDLCLSIEGIDLNRATSSVPSTFLAVAKKNGRIEMIKAMLKRGANPMLPESSPFYLELLESNFIDLETLTSVLLCIPKDAKRKLLTRYMELIRTRSVDVDVDALKTILESFPDEAKKNLLSEDDQVNLFDRVFGFRGINRKLYLLLLDYGADPFKTTGWPGRPFEQLCEKDEADLVRETLERRLPGKVCQGIVPGYSQNSCVEKTWKHYDKTIFKLLLEYGFDPSSLLSDMISYNQSYRFKEFLELVPDFPFDKIFANENHYDFGRLKQWLQEFRAKPA